MRYELKNGISYRMDGKDDEMMANFTAKIVRETSYLGGVSTEKTLTLAGERVNPEGGSPIKLPDITVSDTEFASMSWPLKYWGVACVILPGSGIKDDLRTAIQLLSKPERQTIYRHTGWTTLESGERAYLHRGGAIKATGNDPGVTVQLPPELRYDLRCAADPKTSVKASLALTGLAQADLTWPLLAATLAPLYGACDFAVHVTGRTGSFKSEVLSLFQSHYGPEMDARHLPGSWSSSENALEAMAFLACNAAFCIDDFVPHGSSWQQRQYQGKAERIFRAQGNQSGRQRLTDVSQVQQTMYPRGVVLSTGEDTPEGHSVRGRMIIREIKPGDVSGEALSAAQANRPLYCGTTAWLAQQLAAQPVSLKERAAVIRDTLKEVGHSRTPSTLGTLIAVAEDFLGKALTAKLIAKKDYDYWLAEAHQAIIDAGKEQSTFLEATDPVDVFIATLKQVFNAGSGHLRSVSGGVPRYAEQLGWTGETSAVEDLKQYKARGQCIGWVSAKRAEVYLNADAAITLAKKVAGPDIPLSKNTLMKRIAEAGRLSRRDDTRKKNKVRVQCEGAMREVLALPLKEFVEVQVSEE